MVIMMIYVLLDMMLMMVMLMTTTMVMLMMMTMVMMLMINKDGQTSQEADLQSWPLLHLRTAARTQPVVHNMDGIKEETDDDYYHYVLNKRGDG